MLKIRPSAQWGAGVLEEHRGCSQLYITTEKLSLSHLGGIYTSARVLTRAEFSVSADKSYFPQQKKFTAYHLPIKVLSSSGWKLVNFGDET